MTDSKPPKPTEPPVQLTAEQFRELLGRVAAVERKPDPLMMTMTEAGKVLGVSRWFIQLLIRKGKLRFIPSGTKTKYVTRAELERWMRESQVTNGPEYRRAIDGRRRENRMGLDSRP